jgi:hypothetical protein
MWLDLATKNYKSGLLGPVSAHPYGDIRSCEWITWPIWLPRVLMSTHASVLIDSVEPESAEVCRAAASFP